MEGVGYQKSGVEVVEGAAQNYATVTLPTEKGKADLARHKGLVDAFMVTFLDGDVCSVKQPISRKFRLSLPPLRCWFVVSLRLFLGRCRNCCHYFFLLRLSRGLLRHGLLLHFLLLDRFYFNFFLFDLFLLLLRHILDSFSLHAYLIL